VKLTFIELHRRTLVAALNRLIMDHHQPLLDASPPKKKSRRSRKSKPKPLKSLNITGIDTFYYGTYTEFCQNSRVYPRLFKLPSEALCYQLSRYMKDGHVQSWQSWLTTVDPPDCVKILGRVAISKDECSKSALGKAGERERLYFKSVQFYEYSPSIISKGITSTYVNVQKGLFHSCIATFKPVPDYQSSAGSIYKSFCCPSLDHEIEHIHNPGMHTTIDRNGFYRLGSNLLKSKLTEFTDEGVCNLF